MNEDQILRLAELEARDGRTLTKEERKELLELRGLSKDGEIPDETTKIEEDTNDHEEEQEMEPESDKEPSRDETTVKSAVKTKKTKNCFKIVLNVTHNGRAYSEGELLDEVPQLFLDNGFVEHVEVIV